MPDLTFYSKQLTISTTLAFEIREWQRLEVKHEKIDRDD
jgi:hypothetical protein